MKKIPIYAMLSLVLALLVSPGALAMKDKPTIVDVAIGVNSEGPYAGSFDILIAALVAEENLLKRLSGRGQYTVFAPTDDAFEALFAELGLTPEQVLADKQLLSKVLHYHVAYGARDAADVTSSSRIRTLQQGFLKVNGAVLTDQNNRDANIIVTDVMASNGVIHVIDRVVLPK